MSIDKFRDEDEELITLDQLQETETQRSLYLVIMLTILTAVLIRVMLHGGI